MSILQSVRLSARVHQRGSHRIGFREILRLLQKYVQKLQNKVTIGHKYRELYMNI
jgi:hypothetical protein